MTPKVSEPYGFPYVANTHYLSAPIRRAPTSQNNVNFPDAFPPRLGLRRKPGGLRMDDCPYMQHPKEQGHPQHYPPPLVPQVISHPQHPLHPPERGHPFHHQPSSNQVHPPGHRPGGPKKRKCVPFAFAPFPEQDDCPCDTDPFHLSYVKPCSGHHGPSGRNSLHSIEDAISGSDQKKHIVKQVLDMYVDYDLIDNFFARHRLDIPKLANTTETKAVKKRSRQKQRKIRKPFVLTFAKGTRSNSETGYFGVRISTSGKRFRSTATFDGKSVNVGTFDCVIDAAKAYDTKLMEMSNCAVARSRLNFPELFSPSMEE